MKQKREMVREQTEAEKKKRGRSRGGVKRHGVRKKGRKSKGMGGCEENKAMSLRERKME